MPNTEQPRSKPSLGRVVLIAITVGMVLRLALAAISIGTNDARTWEWFGDRVGDMGILDAYRAERDLNHPPMPVLWSWMAAGIAKERWFAFIMKLPAIAGDGLSIWLLAKIWQRRGDARRAGFAAFAMALSPIALLISGYHCNTDDLYAFLALLTMYLITDRRAYLLGGLALAGAINVKLIPILLIPGAYSLCRSWRDAIRLTGGLAIGVFPFLPLAVHAFDAMQRNMISYAPPVSEWGVAMLLHMLFEYTEFKRGAYQMMTTYLDLGRWLILLCVGALSLVSLLKRRWNGYEVGVLTFSILLILAPGFGPQYMVTIVPLLLAVSIPRSWVYGVLGGTYIALAYFSRLVSHGIPLETAFVRNTPTPPGSIFGLMAWAVLLETAIELVISPFSRRSRRLKATDDDPK